MLSENCIKNEKCDDHWFWILVVLAVVAYMLWYTLKNDIFKIPAGVIRKMCRKFSQDRNHVYYIDKGYFGIMIYFVQVTVILRLTFIEDTRKIAEIFSQIESYLTLGLSVEISLFSESVCPMKDLTTTQRFIFKFVFVFSIFCTWLIVFSGTILTSICIGIFQKTKKIGRKLILGLVEIVKYTYIEFTFVAFKSLTCVLITENQVWLYDSSVQCYSYWQIAMIFFIVLYCLPYPVMLYLGMKMLQKKQTSRKLFYVGVCFPLLSSVYWSVSVCRQENKRHNENIDHDQDNVDDENSAEGIIYSGFKGGYRESTEGTQYWECIIMTRRLLLSATALIPNSVIQLSACLALCLSFLVHHVKTQPFKHIVSNKSETLSLTLLCGVAAVNLLKAALLSFGVDHEGAALARILNLALAEKVFILVLLAFILCFETVFLWKQRAGKALHKRAAGHDQFQHLAQAMAWMIGFRPQNNDKTSQEQRIQGQHSDEEASYAPGPSSQGSGATDSLKHGNKKQGSAALPTQEQAGQTNEAFQLEVKVEAEPKARISSRAQKLETSFSEVEIHTSLPPQKDQ